MRRLIKERFLPEDYEQHLFAKFLKCKQGTRTVSDYSSEFMRLLARTEIAESEQQLVTRFIDGLNTDIILEKGVTPAFTLSKAQSLALRAESKACCRSNVRAEHEFKQLQSVNSRPKTFPSESDKQVSSDAAGSDNVHKGIIGSNNPYAKPRGDLCYRCKQPGHISNQCPRRHTNIVDGEATSGCNKLKE